MKITFCIDLENREDGVYDVMECMMYMPIC